MSKSDLMTSIEEEVRNCSRCGLWRSRKNAVPGEGSLDAAVVFIGEAPGYWEDVKGRPFVGAAGKLLDEMLLSVGFSRNEVYITNILKCRPPRNRDPIPDEVKTCTPYLNRQLQIIKPRLIVTLGRHSAKHILSKLGHKISGITRVRGKIYETELFGWDVHIIPTFHPAAALYNVRLRDYLEKDFQLLKRELETDEDQG